MNAALPRYRCHKEVRAVKIQAIRPFEPPVFKNPTCKGSLALGTACGHCERCELELSLGPNPGALIVPEEGEAFQVTRQYIARHCPYVGGYFVQYDDGYQSFSPAKAFEEGYTKL